MSDPEIKVDIDSTEMRAFVTVEVPPGSDLRTLDELLKEEDVLNALKSAGVVYGIRKMAVQSLITERRWGQRIQVAHGDEVVHGDNGTVKYYFDFTDKPRPKELTDGRVDYREIGLVHNVNEDDLLAVRTPPVKGVAGVNVKGEIIEPREGRETHLWAGRNTYFSDEDQRELRASQAGSVSMRNGVVNVDSTFLVKEHVDYSTGNINFLGDVVVLGDVKAGFKVKAGGKVEVRGVVEDAVVEAGGDVMIKAGFKGSGRGRILSKGDVHLKLIENQKVEARGSVYVGEVSMHARITAGNRILLTTGSGAVIGGSLKAGQSVTAKVLGNAQYAATRIEVEQCEAFDTELENKERAIAKQRAEIARVGQALEELYSKKAAGGDSLQEVEANIRKLRAHVQLLKSNLQVSIRELHVLEVNREKLEGLGTVSVLIRVYPGTKIIIGRTEYEVNEEGAKTTFKNLAGEIVNLTLLETALA